MAALKCWMLPTDLDPLDLLVNEDPQDLLVLREIKVLLDVREFLDLTVYLDPLATCLCSQ